MQSSQNNPPRAAGSQFIFTTLHGQQSPTGMASVDWIAEQMGDTRANMIRQHDGTWINEDGPDVIGILQHALSL